MLIELGLMAIGLWFLLSIVVPLFLISLKVAFYVFVVIYTVTEELVKTIKNLLFK